MNQCGLTIFGERGLAALRGLQNGRGDINVLRGKLEGFCRLRIVIRNIAGKSSGWNTPTAATWFMKPS
jgi:hypothetical protein